jgi:DNA-binding MarR family transcriptional regulator
LAKDTIGDDRRQRRWFLTPQGQTQMKKLRPRWEAAQQAFERCVGRPEALALKQASFTAASRLAAS